MGMLSSLDASGRCHFMVRETRQSSATSAWAVNDWAIDQKCKALPEGQDHLASRRLSSEAHFGTLLIPAGRVKSGHFSGK
jgi:hypothetical protein